MSDTHDDPLLGLLTDIAEGVAALSAWLTRWRQKLRRIAPK